MLLSNTNGLFGIRAEVRGLHHLDYNKPAIVVANHQSSIDLMSEKIRPFTIPK